MSRFVVFQIVLLCCFVTAATHAEVYRWINDRGELVFGDKPPKGAMADAVPINEATGKGMTFATPEQIEKLHENAKQGKPSGLVGKKTTSQDAYCRRYRSDLNKVEIYLQHTYSERDVLRARDLRKLLKHECGGVKAVASQNSSQCNSYRQEILKTEIYLEHTPNPRDKQRVLDLRKQIARECN